MYQANQTVNFLVTNIDEIFNAMSYYITDLDPDYGDPIQCEFIDLQFIDLQYHVEGWWENKVINELTADICLAENGRVFIGDYWTTKNYIDSNPAFYTYVEDYRVENVGKK